jgi:uncharacterized protein YjiS (DUF1127 family)
MRLEAVAQIALPRPQAPRLRLADVLRSAITAIARRRTAVRNRQHTRELLAMSDYLLEDIGVDRFRLASLLASRWHEDVVTQSPAED